MPTSYNGWPASPDLSIRPLVVAGESFVPGVLDDDDVYAVLQYVAEQMHARVEPIVQSGWHQMDDWGFSYRASTGDSSALSCHASGTAIDYNATRHPYNVPTSRNFTSAQIAEIRAIVIEAGVIRWGGEWNTSDAMHFEIKGTRAEVAAAANRIRNNRGDEFDMADLDDLRRIVREELRDPEYVAKIAAHSKEALLDEAIAVTNASGTKTTKTVKALLRETWQKLGKLT